MGSKRRRSRSDDEALSYLKRISKQSIPSPAFPDGTVATMTGREMFEFLKGRIVAQAEADTAARPVHERYMFSHSVRMEGAYREALASGMVDPVLIVDATEGKGAHVDLVEMDAHPRAHVARIIGPDATRAALPQPRPGMITILAIVDRADGGEDLHGYTMPAPDDV